jgi:hypothetical protein
MPVHVQKHHQKRIQFVVRERMTTLREQIQIEQQQQDVYVQQPIVFLTTTTTPATTKATATILQGHEASASS